MRKRIGRCLGLGSFGLGFGWLFDPVMLPQLGAMMVGQYLLKFALAALDTPIFYVLTRKEHATPQLSTSSQAA